MHTVRCSGSVVRALDCQSRGWLFEYTCCRFEAWEVSFIPLCLCLSDETLSAVDPFYLVSMPGEVKDPTQGVHV